MKTHVIILAQGRQSRLPTLTVAKQLIPLPACADTPIMYRTIRQCWHLLGASMTEGDPSHITVVSWLPVIEKIIREGVRLGGELDVIYHPRVDTLIDPGNSSLKGVSRYLRGPALAELVRTQEKPFERTVILLGDVVYSWACLRAIFAGTHWHMGFVGTSTLSPSLGELWGVMWERTAEETMLSCLDAALTKHPPFSDYQPGQMRRWLWEIDHLIDGPSGAGHPRRYDPARSWGGRTWYRPIDDYTRDIDLPEHVAGIPKLSEMAAADDRGNGVVWP